ncbi:MAG: phosphoglycerate dehydrogenase, partial [Clostridiales bacterium]
MTKILVAEKLNEKGLEVLYNSGMDIVYNKDISREELLSTIHEYEGLIVRSLPVVDKELLAK